MKIITIFNYPDEPHLNALCLWWLKKAKECCAGLPIHVWHEKKLNPELIEDGVIYEQKFPSKPPYDLIDEAGTVHHVCFKLFNLCQETEPFIYIDADAIMYRSVEPLIQASREKPFVAINHQKVLNHTDFIPFKFLNGGVLIVGDPSFLDYDKLVNIIPQHGIFLEKKWVGYVIHKEVPIPGGDQALLLSFCNNLNYDYTHPNIGYAWNSCSKYTVIQADGSLIAIGPDGTHPVYINHYWDRDKSKPWLFNDCFLWEKENVFV